MIRPTCPTCKLRLHRDPLKPDYCVVCPHGHRWELRPADEVNDQNDQNPWADGP
jgi:hypothetical protein